MTYRTERSRAVLLILIKECSINRIYRLYHFVFIKQHTEKGTSGLKCLQEAGD